jgi:hypothetical protein
MDLCDGDVVYVICRLGGGAPKKWKRKRKTLVAVPEVDIFENAFNNSIIKFADTDSEPVGHFLKSGASKLKFQEKMVEAKGLFQPYIRDFYKYFSMLPVRDYT